MKISNQLKRTMKNIFLINERRLDQYYKCAGHNIGQKQKELFCVTTLKIKRKFTMSKILFKYKFGLNLYL